MSRLLTFTNPLCSANSTSPFLSASQAEVNRLQQALQEARREQGLWRAAQRTAAQVHEQHVQRLQGDRARWRAKVSTSDRRIAELQAVLAEDPPLELEGLQAEAEVRPFAPTLPRAKR